jgi:23S rRNA (cytidine1920-2'-O)/16S rRNA (cytidine1409-2'-O)-methyltransferase
MLHSRSRSMMPSDDVPMCDIAHRRGRQAGVCKGAAMAKRRLDTVLTERGLFPSRSRAAASVMAGEVFLEPAHPGRRRAQKPGELVDPQVQVSVQARPQYVSRGGVKLANALDSCGVQVQGRRVLDVGASTGGFADCVLQRGAREVIAVDVGYGTLDYGLRSDPRVRVLERTNARALKPAMLPAPATAQALARPCASERTAAAVAERDALPDLATIDVSFISLTKVLGPVLGCLASGYDVLALVKPQFEVGRGRVGKGGVVRDAGHRRQALVAVGEAALAHGTAVLGYHSSGLPGPKGNRETFIWLADPAQRMGAGDAAELERMASEVEP